MEDNITEKFALLNLIKALQGISSPASEAPDKAETPPPATPEPYISAYQGMTNMLARHEAIVNRVKNKR